jgi:hypothetical protein
MVEGFGPTLPVDLLRPEVYVRFLDAADVTFV